MVGEREEGLGFDLRLTWVKAELEVERVPDGLMESDGTSMASGAAEEE